MAWGDEESLFNPDFMQKASEHLGRNDSKLSPVIRDAGLPVVSPGKDLFFSLVTSILSQQLSPRASDTIIGRFVSLFPGNRPVPDIMAELDDDIIRSCGVSRQKIGYLRSLAAHVADGALDLSELNALDDDGVIEKLTSVKGIGVWTAKMILIFTLGRPNVLPHEDVGVLNSMKRLYGMKAKPDRKTVERIARKWSPYCSVASLYLWKLKDELPIEKEY